MTRRLLTLVSLLSLALCLAAAVLWVRSYSAAEVIWGYSPYRQWLIGDHRGECTIVIKQDPSQLPFNQPTRWSYERPTPLLYGGEPPGEKDSIWHWMGFGSADVHWADSGTWWRAVVFPWWSAVAALSLPPAWSAWSRFSRSGRSRRRSSCHCAACGYDLRATPSRCSECGAVPVEARL